MDRCKQQNTKVHYSHFSSKNIYEHVKNGNPVKNHVVYISLLRVY